MPVRMRKAFRCRLGGTAAVVAAIAACLIAPAAASADPVPALSAAGFRDSIGLNTHASYYDTAYGDWPRVVEKLASLGVDHLRDGMYARPGWEDWSERFYRAIELAASHGMRFTVNMGEPNFWGGTLDQLMPVVKGRLRHAIEQFEGPNEYDLYHAGPNWTEEVRAYQRELYSRIKADADLRQIPVLGPSLVFPDSDAKLGDLRDALDAGNVHPYTGGDEPTPGHARHQWNEARAVSGDEPMQFTEAGYHNAMAATHGQPPVPEDVGASYLLRMYLEYFRVGVARTYAYEVIDEKPNPALNDPEQHFGLLRNDYSEKPAFVALKRMLRLIGRPDSATPGSLNLHLGGDTVGVQSLLLKKTDRSYTLVLWQSDKEWDTRWRRPLATSERSVRLSLPAEAEVSASQPVRSGDPVWHGRGRDIPLTLPPDPTLVELDFGASQEPPGVPPPPTGTKTVPATKCPAKLAGSGGLSRKRSGAKVRVRPDRSRRRMLRYSFCSTRDGWTTIEARGARNRLFARRKVAVTSGHQVTGKLRWSTKVERRGFAKGRTLVVRVRHRATGAKRDVVMSGRIRLPRR